VGDPGDRSFALDIYGPSDAQFTLYEDDGTSFVYREGGYRRTRISSTVAPGSFAVKFSAPEGWWVPAARNWQLRMHLMPSAPAAITAGGLTLQQYPDCRATTTGGWSHDAARAMLTICLPGNQEPSDVGIALR
jgi:hypothetical protein